MKYITWLLLILPLFAFSHNEEADQFPYQHSAPSQSNSLTIEDDVESFQEGSDPDSESPCREDVEEGLRDKKIQKNLEFLTKDACRSTGSLTDASKAALDCPKFDWTKCLNHGLTWVVRNHFCESGLNFVGCSWCNPYKGDTWCWNEKPLLCIHKANDVRPDYPITGPGYAMPVEFYHGWSGGHIKATDPIRGCFIFSKKHADWICRRNFGNKWEMASHGDGKFMVGMGGSNLAYSDWNWSATYDGGWNFYAYGNFEADDTRYWTYIHDQPGNCWN